MAKQQMMVPRDLDPWPEGAEGAEGGVAVDNFTSFMQLLAAHSSRFRSLDKRSKKLTTAAVQYVMLVANQPSRTAVIDYMCELLDCGEHRSLWKNHWSSHASDIHLAIKDCLGIVADNGPFLLHSILTDALVDLRKKQKIGQGPDTWGPGDREVLGHAVRVYGLAPDAKSKLAQTAPARARLVTAGSAIEISVGGSADQGQQDRQEMLPEGATELPAVRGLRSDNNDADDGTDADLGVMLHGMRAHQARKHKAGVLEDRPQDDRST